jgi:hypothetical protein
VADPRFGSISSAIGLESATEVGLARRNDRSDLAIGYTARRRLRSAS